MTACGNDCLPPGPAVGFDRIRMLRRLFLLADFDQQSCREIDIKMDDKTIELFILHRDRQFFAYVNSCPHTGVNLNWQPNEFLDFEQQYIQCSMHGALFEIKNGYCVRGPCVGASLQAIELIVEDDTIYVDSQTLQS